MPLYATPPEPAPGGAEVQMHFLARALAERGLRVCHIVHGEPWLPAQSSGVDLVALPTESGSHSKAGHARRVLHALRSADASVYVGRSAGSTTGILASFARASRRRFVLSVSWDGDLVQPLIPGRFGRASFRLGVRLAHTIVLQTEDQRRSAAQLVDAPLTVIRSIAEPSADAGLSRSAFLWIGRIVDYKDPLAYLDLAQAVPDAQFWMVADLSPAEDEAIGAEIRRRASALPNLELLPTRPKAQLGELYDRAVAVVNTSTVEGFPNTFMEGWARGAPALSFRLDPDRILERNRIGTCAEGSPQKLAKAAKGLWDRGADPELSGRARDYIAEHHSPGAVAARWEELIRQLAPAN